MTKHSTQPFESAVAVVCHAIELAGRRGDGAGMPKLRERIDELVAPTGPTSRGVQAQIETVHAAIVSSITTSLVERSRRRLIDRLRETCGGPFDEDPWACIDPDVFQARVEQIRRARIAAASRAVRATEHYTRIGRTQHLRDAVKILEGCLEHEARVTSSRLTASNCDAEMERLSAALPSSIPPWAWAFFAGTLQGDVRSTLTASGIRLTPALARHLDAWFQQASWGMPAPSDDLVCRGRWFEDPLESAFKRFLQDEREVRKAEAAKHAEERRRFEEWEARRASERKDSESRLGSQDADNVAPAEKKGAPQAGAGGKASASPEHADGYELVQLADGPKRMASAMAAAVRQALARQERQDQMEAEQEEARKFHYERIGKQYEPKPRRYFL